MIQQYTMQNRNEHKNIIYITQIDLYKLLLNKICKIMQRYIIKRHTNKQ